MWHFKEKVLVGVAFIDTETYIHRALALKNFILIADVNRSVQLLRYQVVMWPLWCHVTIVLWSFLLYA